MRPSQLRKRTDNIDGKIDQWRMRYEQGYGLKYAGELLIEASNHMRRLQDKVDAQAKHIRNLEAKNETD